MKNIVSRCLRFLFYFTALNIVFTIHAAAYIDPATTSYIIQIVAGIAIAAGTAVGIFWNKLKRKFKKTDTDTAPVRQETQGKGGIVTAEDLMSDDDE